jgi:hypothetical protein
MHHELTIEQARRTIFLGKAIITFLSPSGKHFTYKIKQSKNNKNLYFVSVLTGTDNYRNYTYIGIVIMNGLYTFRITEKSRLDTSAPSVVAFQWTIKHLFINDLQGVQVYHEGKCLRCGRRLTVPESIRNGVGPECIHYI